MKLPRRNDPEYNKAYYRINRRHILAKGCARQKFLRRQFRRCIRSGRQIDERIVRDLFSRRRASSKQKGIPFRISFDEFVCWWRKQKLMCFYCERSFAEIISDGDGLARCFYPSLDRRDNAGPYVIGNLALCEVQTRRN